jgi:hypothetical protein
VFGNVSGRRRKGGRKGGRGGRKGGGESGRGKEGKREVLESGMYTFELEAKE